MFDARRKACADRAATLDLLGPMRLTGADGADYTSRSTHRQAMLAVIALAGRGGVSRARLQDLFWGDKDTQRAAQSLRTALHGLRRELAECDPALIEITPSLVRLDPDVVSVDLLRFLRDGVSALPTEIVSDPPDVLEGIDLPAEGFEEWLRDQRMQWRDRIIEAAAEPPRARLLTDYSTPPAEDLRPVIGLLQPVIHSRSINALYLAEALVDCISDGLRDYVGARVFDYRDRDADTCELDVQNSPSLYLRFRLYELGDSVSLRVLVMDRSNTELLWFAERGPIRTDRACLEHSEVLGLLGEVVERTSGTLASGAEGNPDAPITPFHALTSMFQLDHQALDDLEAELERAWQVTNAPIYPALLAYQNTFRVGEHWQTGRGTLEEDTRRLVAQVRSDPASGGLALGMVGHAAGYVLHDHEGAGDMLQHALRMAPQSAFCWDHLALHCTYGGKYDLAQVASRNALRLGAFSPISFTMQTTRSMIATLQGDFPTATDLGARVLSLRPNFGAALRYMSIALAHRGDIDGAKDCVQRLRSMDPAFSVDWVRDDRMAVRDARAKRILIEGLTKAGAD
ncbi:hypothetical protein PARPLA_03302 [Rhodobacteraceae bacterium THAF1]|uniref:hypothetical protein n=1 Tax=Palleronia sp. THAF1 TaxID=2587842 RepID=UPI000F4173F8|nr:hypothetical protein [Palleronia sp. THAF1]QFU10314.1 hypothetical protein FIU81_16655 [Palleronia sp. THAF1]VDC31423.1 hypothetical protein PARPLA_03302 [Rhodobacteraceae bacterium THAF1]